MRLNLSSRQLGTEFEVVLGGVSGFHAEVYCNWSQWGRSQEALGGLQAWKTGTSGDEAATLQMMASTTHMQPRYHQGAKGQRAGQAGATHHVARLEDTIPQAIADRYATDLNT